MYLIGAPKAGQKIIKQTNISNYNSVKLSEKKRSPEIMKDFIAKEPHGYLGELTQRDEL